MILLRSTIEDTKEVIMVCTKVFVNFMYCQYYTVNIQNCTTSKELIIVDI